MALAVAGAIRLAFFVGFARFIDLSGDESFYFRGAYDVLNLIGIDNVGGRSREESIAAIVAHGWFMPGGSIVLAPVRLIAATVPPARLYVGALNFALLVTIVRLVGRRFGNRSGVITAILGGTFPTMLMFSFTFWGEMLAGQLVVVVLLLLLDATDRLVNSAVPIRQMASVGALLVAVVYLRPGYLILVPIVLLVVLLSYLHFRASLFESIRGSVVSGLVIASLVLAGIAPWSYVLSSRKGGFFLTTTSLELNLIVTFGLPEDVGAVPPAGSPFVAWNHWIDDTSTRLGQPYAEVLAAERKRVLSKIDFEHYQNTVQRQLVKLYLRQNNFLKRFIRLVEANPESSDFARSSVFHSAMRVVNTTMWRTLLLLGFVLLLVPVSPKRRNWWLALMFKAAFIGISLQPFVSVSHPRYYAGLTPLLVVTAGVVATSRFPALRFAWSDRLRDLTVGEKGVLLIQGGALIVFFGVMLLFVAR